MKRNEVNKRVVVVVAIAVVVVVVATLFFKDKRENWPPVVHKGFI